MERTIKTQDLKPAGGAYLLEKLTMSTRRRLPIRLTRKANPKASEWRLPNEMDHPRTSED